MFIWKPNTKKLFRKTYSGKEKKTIFKGQVIASCVEKIIIDCNGSYYGTYSDRDIAVLSKFENNLKYFGEITVDKFYLFGDKAYSVFPSVKTQYDYTSYLNLASLGKFRARVENANSDLKRFDILTKPFRNKREVPIEDRRIFHSRIFKVLANIVNINNLARIWNLK